MEINTSNNKPLIEQKALEILESYSGANNYLLRLKRQQELNNKFYPTRAQAEYIVTYHNVVPKVAKKWVDLDPYFAQKIADEKLYTKVPEKIWIEKLLVEKDKSYHIWGKIFENEDLHEIWLPKGAIIKTHKVEKVEIDYSKYSHRPPLNHQKEAIEKLVGCKRFILADDMGLGKAEFIENKVFTPYGRKRIGDLKIGDEVIGSNGKKCSVIGVYPQGVKDLYRVTFNDEVSILVCKEHLFSVNSRSFGYNTNNSRNKESIVLSVEQMLDNDLFLEINGSKNNLNKKYKFKTYYKEKGGNNKWQIPMVKPIEFISNELKLNPYLLGLILGDGGITQKGITFTTEDDEILNYIKDVLPENSQITENKKSKYGYRLTKKTGHTNPIIQILKELNLMGCGSHNKFIPNIYKYSSINDRLEILKGLMDTDGYCSIGKEGNFEGTEFSTVSERLCDDVIEIVHSLGGIARKKSRTTNYTYKGEKKEGKKSYRVNIKLPIGMNPFKLKRKYELYNTPKKYKVGRYIKDIKFEGSGEAVCISVDSPDKLYVTEHAIVTHNTTSTIIAALETGVKKILIISPASLKINWMREIQNYTDRSVYICEGKNFSSEHDFVIMNYDIVKNFHDIKEKNNSQILKTEFDLVILDECFTYDTKIMTEKGEINIGDIVETGMDVKILTYNHKKEKLEYKKINRWIKKNKDTIYKIKLNNGLFIECTDNHKFYVNNKGYVKAKELTTTDDLYMLPKTSYKETNLERGEILFKEMLVNNKEQNVSTETERNEVPQKLPGMWEFNEFYNRNENEKENILFSKMFKQSKIKQSGGKRKKKRNNRKKWGVVKNNEKYSYEKSSYGKTIFSKNEKKQSDEKFGEFRKNEKKIKRKNIFIKRRKWKNNTTTTNVISDVRRRVGNGIANINRKSKNIIQKFTTILQSRHRKSEFENINRNRWEIPQNKKMEILGQTKNKNIEFIRVESIEILERGSYDKSSKLYSENTRVYDLEIEDNHNYFANTILVSNCHYLQNTQAQRTKLINSFAKKADRLWLLTGTPMTSRPINYFNLLNLIESPVAQNWMAYAIRYCEGYQFKAGFRKVWNVKGASNLEELRDRTSRQVLRRLKEDVLDLPDKIITPVYLRLKSKLYEELMGEYFDWYRSNSEESSSLTLQFSKLTKVRQIIAEEKISSTIELCENIIEQGKKVIIFTNFTNSLQKIVEHFGKQCVFLDGSCTQPQRQYAVDQFQNNDKITVFVGNIKAAGVGITLTSAEAVIMNDLSFLPSDHSQAEDRAYRYGQKSNVSVYYPIFENTIEGIIYDILSKKKAIIETVMGDNLDKSDFVEEVLKSINNSR